MSDFLEGLKVDLLDSEICKGRNFWGCIAECLGIDPRIIANPTVFEEIKEHLRTVANENFTNYVKTENEEQARVKRRATNGNINIEVLITQEPRTTIEAIKSAKVTTLNGSTANRVEIESGTGKVTIRESQTEATKNNEMQSSDPAFIKTYRETSYVVAMNGNIVRIVNERKEGPTRTNHVTQVTSVIDPYGIEKERIEKKQWEGKIVKHERKTRHDKFPFAVIIEDLKTGTPSKPTTFAINRNSILSLKDTQFEECGGGIQQIIVFRNEEEMKDYFKKHSKRLAADRLFRKKLKSMDLLHEI